jgi:hypothetical protein
VDEVVPAGGPLAPVDAGVVVPGVGVVALLDAGEDDAVAAGLLAGAEARAAAVRVGGVAPDRSELGDDGRRARRPRSAGAAAGGQVACMRDEAAGRGVTRGGSTGAIGRHVGAAAA